MVILAFPVGDGRASSVRVLASARCICGKALTLDHGERSAIRRGQDTHRRECPLQRTTSERPYREALDREVARETQARTTARVTEASWLLAKAGASHG